MKKPREDIVRIAAEAAQWQRALQTGDAQVRAEFTDWVKASPRHLREFMLMEALDAAAQDIDPQREIDVEANLSKLEENVVSLPRPSQGSAALLPDEAGAGANDRIYLRPAARAAAVAAALIAALALTWWLVPNGSWQAQRYSTEVGEQRTVELRDGSVLQLNTQSRVRVRFSRSAREIRLIAGEALFKVAHDASRPFRVHTDDAVIRAVGTQFNVDRHAGDTQVVVLEGTVEIQPVAPGSAGREIDAHTAVVAHDAQPNVERVDPAQGVAPGGARLLAAGEAARIEVAGEVTLDVAADVSEATAWRERRLVFREETLANIAEEFNRYNHSPRVVIEGDAARSRRYGGTFDADDPESLAEFVMRRGDLQVERNAARIVIRTR